MLRLVLAALPVCARAENCCIDGGKVQEFDLSREEALNPPMETPPAPEYSCRRIRYHGGAQLFITLLQKETHHCPIVMEY